MLQLFLLLGTSGADSHILFLSLCISALFLVLFLALPVCKWSNILIPTQFKCKIVKTSNAVQCLSCLLNGALIYVALSWSKVLIYN